MTGVAAARERQQERGKIHHSSEQPQELQPTTKRVTADALEKHFAPLADHGVQILTYRQTQMVDFKVMVELMRDTTCHARVCQGDKLVPFYKIPHWESKAAQLAAKYGVVPLFTFNEEESPTGRTAVWGFRPERRVVGAIRAHDGSLQAAPNDYADLRDAGQLAQEFSMTIAQEIAGFYGQTGSIDLNAISFVAMPNGDFSKSLELLKSEDARRGALHIVNSDWDARLVFREIIMRATADGRKVSDIFFEPLGDVGRGGEPLYRVRFGTNKRCEDVDLVLDEPGYKKLVNLLDTWGKEINSRDRSSPDAAADAAIRLRHEVLGLGFVSDVSEMEMSNAIEKGTPVPFPEYTKGLSFRTNRLPTVHGQSVTLRIQYPSRFSSVRSIGYTEMQCDVLTRLVEEPEGMLLMTGPTGEGKTTTLYAFLAHLNTSERRILTVEEPVEMELPGVVQVKLGKDLGFSEALRAALRSSPNVILVGEIRDKETASVAVQAGLTGHFVLSTLHTRNAIGVVSRMDGIGVKPYEVADVLKAANAQRLLPAINQAYAEDLGEGHVKFPEHLFEVEDILPDLNALFGVNYEGELITLKPRSAEEVGDSSFQGKRGSLPVIEILKVDDEIRTLITEKASDQAIARAAMCRSGFRYVPMQFHGLALVLDGKVAYADWKSKFGVGWIEENPINKAFGQAFIKHALENPGASYDDLLYGTSFAFQGKTY